MTGSSARAACHAARLMLICLPCLLASTPAVAGTAASRPAAASAPPASAPAKVDINSATLAQLVQAGLGEQDARAVIDNRPYDAPSDLRKRNILPVEVFEPVKGRLVATTPKK